MQFVLFSPTEKRVGQAVGRVVHRVSEALLASLLVLAALGCGWYVETFAGGTVRGTENVMMLLPAAAFGVILLAAVGGVYGIIAGRRRRWWFTVILYILGLATAVAAAIMVAGVLQDTLLHTRCAGFFSGTVSCAESALFGLMIVPYLLYWPILGFGFLCFLVLYGQLYVWLHERGSKA